MPGELLELEAGQRRIAEVQNRSATSSTAIGLNHLPSGPLVAIERVLWLAVQVIRVNNLVPAGRRGSGSAIVTTRLLRRRYFALAGFGSTHSARRWTLHLAKRWPWA